MRCRYCYSSDSVFYVDQGHTLGAISEKIVYLFADVFSSLLVMSLSHNSFCNNLQMLVTVSLVVGGGGCRAVTKTSS